jgi:hypothetical protein
VEYNESVQTGGKHWGKEFPVLLENSDGLDGSVVTLATINLILYSTCKDLKRQKVQKGAGPCPKAWMVPAGPGKNLPGQIKILTFHAKEKKSEQG